ncbi:MAG: rhamnulokinase [Oscillospiraceae bacterium]|nr:rhamnulokinase [Oscillospiraceae bacterium]
MPKTQYYLAVDIGASSGRHILGYLEDGLIRTEEVYRFGNAMLSAGGRLTWGTDSLLCEVREGIKRCGDIGKAPDTVAIDTWAVDYMLLDGAKNELGPAYAYRDTAAAPAVAEVEALITPKELYKRTGIQKQGFNTIYRLFHDKTSGRMAAAEHFLMLPDYIAFRLTGKIANEYTNATTTCLVNARDRTWDGGLMELLGIKPSLFSALSAPSVKLGGFLPEMRAFAGYDAEVVLCPSHDTASAVAGCPLADSHAYISSGTWSLVGVERAEPIITEEGRAANITNEGGIEYRCRVLKNIAGMWLLQGIRRGEGGEYTFDDMLAMAEKSAFTETVDVNAPSLSAPENMTDAVRALLGSPRLPVSDVIRCVYLSLARAYAEATAEISAVTGRRIDALHIIGGGAKDAYLNRLTAERAGKPVIVGAAESTALGNLASQMIYRKVFSDITEARKAIARSFPAARIE